MVLFDGKFSHAFTKPAFNRGSDNLGLTSHDPSPAEIALAAAAFDALPEKPVIARIDMVPDSSGPKLMELELIEPQLALHMVDKGAQLVAEAILRREHPA